MIRLKFLKRRSGLYHFTEYRFGFLLLGSSDKDSSLGPSFELEDIVLSGSSHQLEISGKVFPHKIIISRLSGFFGKIVHQILLDVRGFDSYV